MFCSGFEKISTVVNGVRAWMAGAPKDMVHTIMKTPGMKSEAVKDAVKDVAKKGPGFTARMIKKHPFIAAGGTLLAAKALSGPKQPPPPPPQVVQY